MGVDVLDPPPHLNPPPRRGEELFFWLNLGTITKLTGLGLMFLRGDLLYAIL